MNTKENSKVCMSDFVQLGIRRSYSFGPDNIFISKCSGEEYIAIHYQKYGDWTYRIWNEIHDSGWKVVSEKEILEVVEEWNQGT